MNRFSKAFFAVVLVVLFCVGAYGAGSTPIQSLKLTGNADGGRFAFTNLGTVACGTARVDWVALGTNAPISTWAEAVAAGGALTNEADWLAFKSSGGTVSGTVTIVGDTYLDGNVWVSQTLYVTNLYVTNIWTTITNLNVQGDGRITGSLSVSNGLTLFGPRPTWMGTNLMLQGEVTATTWGGIGGSISSQTDLWSYLSWVGAVSNSVVTNPVAGRITDYDTNAWWQAYAASTNVAVVGGAAPGFIFADASTNLTYMMALTNGSPGTWTNLSQYFNDAGFVTNAAYLSSVGLNGTTWSPITNITFLTTNGVTMDASVMGYKITLTVGTTNLVTLGGPGGWTNLASYYNDAGFLTNGSPGTRTNLASYYNDAGFLTALPAGLAYLSSNNVFTASSNSFSGFVYVGSNATAGIQAVNWRTMTGHLASAGYVTNPVAGGISVSDTQAWWQAYVATTNTRTVAGSPPGFIYADAGTNLTYSTAPLTNNASGVNFGSLTVGGDGVVTTNRMTNYISGLIRGSGYVLMTDNGATSTLYHVTSVGHTNLIGAFYSSP